MLDINTSSVEIPTSFDADEKIIRAIYSPVNIHKTKGTLLSNAFRTPSDIDEVSVNRLDYTTPNFCKKMAVENQNHDRNYFGFAILLKNQIDICSCTIMYSPILTPKEKANVFHADIKIGFIPKRGEQLPSEILKKINDLTNLARFYKDPNPSLTDWQGGVLE